MNHWKPAALASLAALMLAGCIGKDEEVELKMSCSCGGTDGELLKPAGMINLPDEFNSPDGLTIGPDGALYLSVNNVGDQSHPALIARIRVDNTIEEFSSLPPHPETGKASPLGLVFASDGNLYVADNQAFVTEEPGKSRLIRVNIRDGRPVGATTVVAGMTMANGVSAHGNYVVVNDTAIDKTYPLKSGTYRFTTEELAAADGENPIQVKGLEDPHLIVSLKTENREHQVGANGVSFDSKGNMYVCNFGDAEIWKAEFKENGEVKSFTLFCKGDGLECTDGLQIDEDDHLWTADFLGNAIARICPDGTVKIIAKNEPGDGIGGSMDAPSECIRFGNVIYVSNIDLTYGPNESDKLHSISLFELPE